MKGLRSYKASNIDLQPWYLYLIRPKGWLDIPNQGLFLVGNLGFSLNNEALTRSFIRESLAFYWTRRQDGDFVKSYSNFLLDCTVSAPIQKIIIASNLWVSVTFFICCPFYNNFSYFTRVHSIQDTVRRQCCKYAAASLNMTSKRYLCKKISFLHN